MIRPSDCGREATQQRFSEMILASCSFGQCGGASHNSFGEVLAVHKGINHRHVRMPTSMKGDFIHKMYL